MAYIVGQDRTQTRMITTSLDSLIDKDNSVRVIDAYVESLDLRELGFTEYSGLNRGQPPYRRSDLLKLHIYGYLNKIKSSVVIGLRLVMQSYPHAWPLMWFLFVRPEICPWVSVFPTSGFLQIPLALIAV